MGLVEWLAAREDRCDHGYHHVMQTCPDCPTDEWTVFRDALRRAVRNGRIHQEGVRPHIQRIPHKHRGLLYRRARMEGLIAEVGREPSTDVQGRNTDKLSRVYEWLGAAS